MPELKVYGTWGALGGPIASRQSQSWTATGTWGDNYRMVWFTAERSGGGGTYASLEVLHVSKKLVDPLTQTIDFEVHNNGSDSDDIYYNIRVVWTDQLFE